MISEIQPLHGVPALLKVVKTLELKLVLASSGKAEHVNTFMDLFDGKSIADAWTSSDDAESSKPAPDLLEVALRKVKGQKAVVVGDATWDAIAARNAGMPQLAILTGGFSTEELREAGALEVYHDLPELQQALEQGLLARL